MIQYYLDLQKQVKAIHGHQLEYGQIQKIYSTSFFISFSIRAPGKTWHLFVGRGASQEGVWLHHEAPPSVLRRKDTFLEYLRKHISSCSFVSLELDQHDRILKFNYQKYGQLQSFLFFWKARKLYFLHYYQEVPEAPFKLLLSWRGKAFTPDEKLEDLYSFFDEVGRRTDMKHDLESANMIPVEELLEAELKAAKAKGMTSGPTFLQRKIHNIEDDLKRAQQWNLMQKILDSGQSLEELYELKIGDHKVKFEGELNPYERRNLLFEKIKKLKRGEGILGQRLNDAKELLAGKSQEIKGTSTLPINRPIWGKEERKASSAFSPPQEKDDYKTFKFENFSIGVGLSTSGNDQLRNKWASKEDNWLHLDGSKSAHVIIKLNNLGPLSSEVLNLGASILAYFSHFNEEWIPIIYTQVKNLKGVTGASGMVIYKKEKHLRCPRVETAVWLKES
jgi:predicted ribosome quality control (RQC) complex YloA/Tae2 family protein